LVAHTVGKDCVMLFHSKELAERHIVEAYIIGRLHPLYPLAIPSADAFRQGLESLPTHVTCATWDATVAPQVFLYMEMGELFTALDA
jgi:hypothetical protein